MKYFFSWPAIGWAVVLLVTITLCVNGFKVKSIKGGSFELVLNENAAKVNLLNSSTFKALKNLNEDELKIFLIMGGEDSKFYILTNARLSNKAALSVYEKLQQDSLIAYSRYNKDPNRDDSTMIYPTLIGAKVHKILIKTIYSELIK